MLVEVWRHASASTRLAVGAWLGGDDRSPAGDRLRAVRAVAARPSARAHSRSSRRARDPVDAVVDSLDRDRARSALTELSDAQRDALELAFFGGLTHVEVAEQLGVPLGTAKTRIRDGLIRLRSLMEAHV